MCMIIWTKNSNPADILDGGGDEKQNFFLMALIQI